MEDLSFVQGWYERGNQEDDSVFKFVSYFIAFNYLYGECHDRKEYEKVKNYAKNSIQPLYNGENIFNLLRRNSEFFENGNRSCRRDRIIPRINPSENNIPDLFYAIYIVRCNLFHGSKAMVLERDKGLVADGAQVLNDFLSKWIDNNSHKCDV